MRFEFQFELKNHREKVHENITNYRFKCDHCHKMFHYKSELKSHVDKNVPRCFAIIKEDDEPVKCKTCSNMFQNPVMYVRHHQRMHGSFPSEYNDREKFPCDHCSNLYLSKKLVRYTCIKYTRIKTFLCTAKFEKKCTYLRSINVLRCFKPLRLAKSSQKNVKISRNSHFLISTVRKLLSEA